MKKYCEKCGIDTEQKIVIKQKPSKYGQTRKEKVKAFIDGLVSGWAGHGLAAVDLMERYIVCQECGNQKKESEEDKFR